MSRRVQMPWTTMLTLALALGGCGGDEKDDGGGVAGNGAADALPVTGDGDGGLPPGLLSGEPPPIPDEVLQGADDDASLQERYATRCEPGAMTISGQLEGAPFEGSFRSGTGGVNPFGQLRSFGQRGEVRVDTAGPAPLFTPVDAEGSHLLLPLDSERPWSLVCGGPGSTFERTPLEEVLELRQAVAHACPGEPLAGQLDACVVFGLDEEICPGGEGIAGELDGEPFQAGGPGSISGGNGTYRMEFSGFDLMFEYAEGEGAVAITSGILVSGGGRLDAGIYCLGEGSTFQREEMDFDDRITLQLRGLSRLPSCEGTSGDGELTACFRR